MDYNENIKKFLITKPFGIIEKRICEGTQFETLRLLSPDFPFTTISALYNGEKYNVWYDSTNTHMMLDSFDEKDKAEERARECANMVFASPASPLKMARSLIKVTADSNVS